MITTTNPARVTVAMPVFNGGTTIRRAIGSILAQEFRDFHLLISDNASTDATQEICQHYAQLDPRVKYIRQVQNLGAAGNFNFLLRNIRTDYFYFAPHDDYWSPGWIGGAVTTLDAIPDASLVLGRIEFIGRNQRAIAVASPPWNLDSETALRRLKLYLSKAVTDHVIYGVIRTRAVKNFQLGLRESAPERSLIFTLIMNGRVVDCNDMAMRNYMSFKKVSELYSVFQFRFLVLASLKTHLSCLSALTAGQAPLVAARAVQLYLSDMAVRKLCGARRQHENVAYFDGDAA